jgi:hypothetical protein
MNKTGYELAQTAVRAPQRRPLPPPEPLVERPPQRSVAGSIFRFIGWMLFSIAALFAVVVIAVAWIGGATVRDLFSRDLAVTITPGQAVVESIKQVNRQVFIEHYNTVDIDYHEEPDNWLGDLGVGQSFVLLLKGRVPAGFDLTQLSEADVLVSSDRRRVRLVLPPPMIFAEDVKIDVQNSRILPLRDYCPEPLCQTALEIFQNELTDVGVQELTAASERSGILTQAAESGQRYYEQLLRSLGFTEVEVIIRAS